MKRIVITLGLVLLSGYPVLALEQSLLARITVYWASGGGGSDRWSRQHICSTGARLRAGHCAVDPRRIPYGSKVMLPDGPLLAVDTGSAVVSRKAARRSGRTALERGALVIDRFFETKQQALSWANRNPYFMLVQVSPPDFRSLPIPPPQKVVRVIPKDIRQQAIPPPQKVVRVIPKDIRQQAIPPPQKVPQIISQDLRQQAIPPPQKVVRVPRRDMRDRPKSRMYMP